MSEVELMRIVFPLLLMLATAFTAEAVPSYDVQYRDYLGTHTVKGVRDNEHTFLYNSSAKKQLKLATLDWPPYIDKDGCRQGWVMQSTIALLHHLGYGATVTFYPWARAVKQVESGKADILFPEYFIDPQAPSDVYQGTRRLDHLVLSDSFGWGPIAFIKRKDHQLANAADLSALSNEWIGVVRGYQNTPEFDRLMDLGSFKIVEALNDFNNLKLLLNRRVNLIVGDPLVIEADVKKSDLSAKEKAAMLAQIEVVEPILQMNALYFAIAKKSKYADVLSIELNQAIASFDKQGVLSEIQFQVGRRCQTLKDKPLQ